MDIENIEQAALGVAVLDERGAAAPSGRIEDVRWIYIVHTSFEKSPRSRSM